MTKAESCPQMAHSPVGKPAQETELGGGQEVTSGVGRNWQRLQVGEGAREGEERSRAEMRKGTGVSDRRQKPGRSRNQDNL